MKEKIREILNEISDGAGDYEGNSLYDAGLLDSMQVVEVVDALENKFQIEIDPEEIVEQNFRNFEAICTMMKRLLG